MVAGTITALSFVVFAGKINGDFKLGQNISFDVQRDLRCIRGSCIALPHERAKMVGSQVDLVGKTKLRRSDSELVSLRCFLENFVAARILDFESQLAIGGGFMVRAIKRQRAHMNLLSWLVDGF